MMVTLSSLVTFFGFWCCYQTSQRVELKATTRLEKWLGKHQPKARLIGVGGMVAGWLLCMVTFGIGSGIFAFLIMLTVISSLVIMLTPLGLMNRRNIAIAALVCTLLEISL